MLALYRSGRQADALSSFRVARKTLVDQVGVDPGEELRGLEQAILVNQPGLELPDGARHAAGGRALPVPRRLPMAIPDAIGAGPPLLVGRNARWVAEARSIPPLDAQGAA